MESTESLGEYIAIDDEDIAKQVAERAACAAASWACPCGDPICRARVFYARAPDGRVWFMSNTTLGKAGGVLFGIENVEDFQAMMSDENNYDRPLYACWFELGLKAVLLGGEPPEATAAAEASMDILKGSPFDVVDRHVHALEGALSEVQKSEFIQGAQRLFDELRGNGVDPMVACSAMQSALMDALHKRGAPKDFLSGMMVGAGTAGYISIGGTLADVFAVVRETHKKLTAFRAAPPPS